MRILTKSPKRTSTLRVGFLWLIGIVWSLLNLSLLPARAEWTLAEMLTENENGTWTINAQAIDDRFRNLWPVEFERQFQKRAQSILAAQRKSPFRGTTYFESEKRWYGIAMANILAGKAGQALSALQARDHQHAEWHRETNGIDFYACFTLKHQMRKYFYFGDLLDPDYRNTMFTGAKKWTSQDPLHRPHYAFSTGETGWGPNAKNSWVDVRSTDNLFLMRVTSVYLMAEETGNRSTAETYKRIILDYVATLYRVGLGEWDSENYLGHSIAPVYNLYDFAADDDVRLAAKAILDWFHAAGAVKYLRGAFNGPTKRDYNHAQPFGGSAPSMLWIPFGDAPNEPDEWESDEIHAITSAYRPPPAVVEFARGEHRKPVEILASKPPYLATTSRNPNATPAYWETQYLAHTYKMGSLASGTDFGPGDTNGFKIVVIDDQKGAVALQAAPTDNPAFPGSPAYKKGIVTAENRVGQFENLAIWLAKGDQIPWLWVIPDDVDISRVGPVTLLSCDRTWVALLPINTANFAHDNAKTAAIALPLGKKKPKFASHRVLSGNGGEEFSGFAVIVGEPQSHRDLDNFRAAVSSATLDVRHLYRGQVTLEFEGRTLALEWSDIPKDLIVTRNDVQHDWSAHAGHLYGSTDQRRSPIASKWAEGALRVESTNFVFECRVSDNGNVEFLNKEKQ